MTFLADDSHQVAEAAFFALLHQRGGELGEPGSCIACLLSLSDELDIWLYDMVADARDAGFSWNRLAALFELSPAQTRRRYADYCSVRNSLRPPPQSP